MNVDVQKAPIWIKFFVFYCFASLFLMFMCIVWMCDC